MSRRLSAEEEALWRAVTATVRALEPRPAPPAPDQIGSPPAPAGPALPDRRGAGPRKVPRQAPPSAPAPRPPARAETLDARWDRRLASGRARPDRVIDLHGLTRTAARGRLEAAVRAAATGGERLLLVITGQGDRPGPDPIDLMQGTTVRGAIRAELPRWLADPGLAPLIAAVRQAHGRQGGLGAVWLVLRRARGGRAR